MAFVNLLDSSGFSYLRTLGRSLLRSCGKVALRPAGGVLPAGIEVTASRTDAAAQAALGAARGAVIVGVAAQVASDAVEGAALVGVVVRPVGALVGCVGVPPSAVAAQVALGAAQGAALAGVAAGTAAAVSVGRFGERPFEGVREWERVKLSGSELVAWTGFSAPAAPTSARFGVSFGVAVSAVPGGGHWDCSRVFRLAACRC